MLRGRAARWRSTSRSAGGNEEGTAGEGGATEDDIALGRGDYEGALEVYGAVDNGVDLGVDAST